MNDGLIKLIETLYILTNDDEYYYLKQEDYDLLNKENILTKIDKLIDIFGFDICNKNVELKLFNSIDFEKVLDYILQNNILDDKNDAIVSENEYKLSFPILSNIHENMSDNQLELYNILHLINGDYEFSVFDTDYPNLFSNSYCFYERKNNNIRKEFFEIQITNPTTIENLKKFVIGLMKIVQISSDLEFINENIKIRMIDN